MLSDSASLAASGVKDGDVIQVKIFFVSGSQSFLQAVPFSAQALAQQMQQRSGGSRQTVNYREKAQELMRSAPRAVIRERWTALADAMDANDVDKVARMLEDQARSTSFGSGQKIFFQITLDPKQDKKKAEEDARLARAEANPQDPENQRYLEERIRQQNVEQSFLEAQENFPEMFGTVVMLYIDVKVNGQRVKVTKG